VTCADEAHETCYDADQVAALVRDVAAFARWFAGQTGAICDTCHALLYYRHDVEAYLGGQKRLFD